MSAVTKLDIRNRLLEGTKVLGNTKVGLKEVCSDLVNDALKKGVKSQRICDGTFLSATTIERIRSLEETENGDPYRPNADTCERILRYFGASITLEEVKIQNRFANKPKA